MSDFRSWLPGLTILAALTFAWAAAPAGAENVVRMGKTDGMPTWDPQGARWDIALTATGRCTRAWSWSMPDLTLVPALAVSWKFVDPTTWQFTLRRGVTFHDGTPLTAEDVVFSIERARGPGSDFRIPDRAGTIAAARALDADTIEVTTTQPDPQLPAKIRLVNILSKAWAERHGVTAATYYADDHGTYAFDHANGTGPFMLESEEHGRRTVLVRNPNWWGAKLYPGNIDRIEWTVIPDREARVRALLDGEIDFLRDVPDEALARIRATPGLKLAPYADLWVDGLFLNQARGAPPGTDVEWSKPFRDRRVREAIYHAIDAKALTEGALQGLGVPTGSLVVPNMPSYSPELDQRLPYDPEKARALLAEAGYGAGFDMELDCRRLRRVRLPRCHQAAREGRHSRRRQHALERCLR